MNPSTKRKAEFSGSLTTLTGLSVCIFRCLFLCLGRISHEADTSPGNKPQRIYNPEVHKSDPLVGFMSDCTQPHEKANSLACRDRGLGRRMLRTKKLS